MSKANEFSSQDKEVAAVAKALSHPARVAILRLLARQNACVCGDIVDQLPLSQSTVSQHLKELKKVGLIKGDIEGVRTCYCIDYKKWKALGSILEQFFGTNVLKLNQCC